MRCWIASTLAALLMAVPLFALDKPEEEKGNDRAAQFKQMQKDFQKTVEQASQEAQKAKSQVVIQRIVAKISKEYTARTLKLVESDPKDKVSGDVLFWAVSNVPQDGTKVYDILAENWAGDTRIKALCERMVQMSDDSAGSLLQKVFEENKDKDIKGIACFALAKIEKDQSESKGDAEAAKKAEKMFEKISKDYTEVKFQDSKLGEQAKSALEDLRIRGVGKKCPNLQSENLKGKKVQLKDYQGKVVVLDIWATWCPPCRAMIPHEREMVEKLKEKPFTLISISADAEKETLEKFLESTKMPWTHWWTGQGGSVLKEMEVRFFPTIYVLDGEGVIRYKNVRDKQLEEAVDKLLAEAKDKK